jgi:hypothetical protein
MKIVQVVRVAVVTVLVALLWVLGDPALAVVAGIISVGIFSVASLRPKPRWIKAFWSYCKDVGQNERWIP